MKNKSLIIGLVIIIVLAVIIIGLIKINQKPADIKKNMTTNELIGKWNAISEEVYGEKNENLDSALEYSITFNEDGSYSKIIGKVTENGFYVIDGDNITFYDSKDQIGKQGSFNSGWFSVKDNELTLTLPKYPKTVVYIRA
jgi:hypothetical protein